MAKFPGLMLWTDAWLADTSHLTRQERGTYLDLLILMWRTPGCRVPNDNQWLSKHMRMTLSEVTGELRPLISEFCQTDGNWVLQRRLQREFTYTKKSHTKQSDRAKSRWNKQNGAYRGSTASGIVPAYAPIPIPPKKEQISAGERDCPKQDLSPLHLDRSLPVSPSVAQVNSASELATASGGDALARSPSTTQAPPKDLAEVRRRLGYQA